MRTQTVQGTVVEITGTVGCNVVNVKVKGRDTTTQVNASDLLKPADVLPPELEGLKFYDPEEAARIAQEAQTKAKAKAMADPTSDEAVAAEQETEDAIAEAEGAGE